MKDVKIIPDKDCLFLRIHRVNVDFNATSEDKSILLYAFDPKPKGTTGLSVDWSEHSSAEESLNRIKEPRNNGITSLNVEKVRAIPLSVLHMPIQNNFSHSEISEIPPRKPTDLGIRVKLRDIAKWEIKCT